jgi:hypothetical protein
VWRNVKCLLGRILHGKNHVVDLYGVGMVISGQGPMVGFCEYSEILHGSQGRDSFCWLKVTH